MSSRRLRSRSVKDFKDGMREIKAQVFHAADYIGVVTAEEYGRAMFRFFVASLPIATGLLQHSAKVSLHGSSKNIKQAVLKDARGNAAPVLEWSGDHWRTRVAYTMPVNPNYVQVKLDLREAFILKKTGISATGGKFGLTFTAGRSILDEPEFVKFLKRKSEETGKDYGDWDVSVIHAELINERYNAMKSDLHYFIDQAKTRIVNRMRKYNKQYR